MGLSSALKYIPSTHTHAYRTRNALVLFQALTNEKAYGGRELLGLWERFVRSPIGALDEADIPVSLITAGFFVPQGSDLDARALARIQQLTYERPLDDIWFFVTDSCTGACRYCRQNIAGVRGKRILTPALTDRFWSWYFRQRSPRRLSLSLFGGEPFILGHDLLKLVSLSRARCAEAGCLISETNVFSNGALIDDRIAHEILRAEMKVVISLDGPAYISDSMRGPNRHDAAIVAMKKLQNAGLEVGVSLVVGAHNVKALPEAVMYVAETVQPMNICLIPLHRTAGAPDDIQPSYEYVAARIFETHDIVAPLGVRVENVQRRLDVFCSGAICASTCGATGKRVTLFPDGTVGPCQSSYIGTDMRVQLSDASLDHRCFVDWIGRSPVNDINCLKCPCLSLCGGGCGLDSVQMGNGLRDFDPKDCAIAHAFLNWVMRKLLDRIRPDTPLRIAREEDLSFLVGKISRVHALPFGDVASLGRIPRSRFLNVYGDAFRERRNDETV